MRLASRFYSFAAACAVALAPFAPASAAPGSFSTDVGAAVGYSSNPFLLDGAAGSAFAEFSIMPRYSIATEKSQTLLEGRYRRTQYLDSYGNSSSYGASALHSEQVNERLAITGQASFDSSIQGERGLLFTPLVEDPLLTPGPGEDFGIDPDATLLGLRQRRNAYQAQVAAALKKSESESLSFSANVARATYPDLSDAFNSWTYGVGAGYARVVSPLTTVGANASIQRIEYDADGGSYTIFSPQATYRRQLSQLWTVDAALGVSIIRGSVQSQSVDSIGLSGQVTGCRQGSITQACFGIAQATGASGFGGVQRSQRAFADYSYRLNEDDRVVLGASYIRYGSGTRTARASELFAANAGLEKRLGQRLLANGGLFVRHGSSGFTGAATDVGGQLGVTYRFGDKR